MVIADADKFNVQNACVMFTWNVIIWIEAHDLIAAVI